MSEHGGSERAVVEHLDAIEEALTFYGSDPNTASRPAEAGLAALAVVRGELQAKDEALRQERVERHVQNLDMALALAESDPLYAEILRPHFQRILAALGSSAGREPNGADKAERQAWCPIHGPKHAAEFCPQRPRDGGLVVSRKEL